MKETLPQKFSYNKFHLLHTSTSKDQLINKVVRDFDRFCDDFYGVLLEKLPNQQYKVTICSNDPSEKFLMKDFMLKHLYDHEVRFEAPIHGNSFEYYLMMSDQQHPRLHSLAS